jgi:cytochrome c biogenesis protein ResB
VTYKQDERNWPSAYVDLITNDGKSLGTWLLSAHPGLEHSAITDTDRPPQTVEVNGHTYSIALRMTRNYKPFSLTLLKFSHDRYAGTDIPKNFSSRIQLTSQDGRENREVLIYMNNPLRYAGLTFYQASFDPDNPKVTILQVVRNPSWLLPYIACSLMALGLVVQFMIHLGGFLGKRRITTPAVA